MEFIASLMCKKKWKNEVLKMHQIGKAVIINNCVYVIINDKGTLEKHRPITLWGRILLEVYQGLGKTFSLPDKEYFYISTKNIG